MTQFRMSVTPSLRTTLNILHTLAVASLLGILTACPPNSNETPTITVTNTPNQTGGQLNIIGSGFIKGNPVKVGILNVPAVGGWAERAGNADSGGGINVTVTYTYPAPNPLPGCAVGNNAPTTSLKVTATDTVTTKGGFANVAVFNCGWAVPQVSQHQ